MKKFSYLCKGCSQNNFSNMTIKVELLHEEALALLRNLERLKLVKLLLPKKKKVAIAPSEPNGSEEKEPSVSSVKPIRDSLTLNQLLEEQQFKGFDRQELDNLISEMNIQEPIEELLAMLKP
ncbi:MAG TPA: hypothetical protein ENJ95_00315 [Bacteroidetes bacterium]|nr:hypothetical protein [Bacteroidota bacterium]